MQIYTPKRLHWVALSLLVLAPIGFLSAGEIVLQPASGGNFRFKDMGGQVYGTNFITSPLR